jgi:LPXTG-motif cell wall-anchored protein
MTIGLYVVIGLFVLLIIGAVLMRRKTKRDEERHWAASHDRNEGTKNN